MKAERARLLHRKGELNMTKKHFIALADYIRLGNEEGTVVFTDAHIHALAMFLHEQNPRFLADRWKDYIAGKCGPNGGAIKREVA